MKIILATESFSPNVSGVAVATQNLANNLTLAGHQVFVLCPSRNNKTHIDKNFNKFTVIRLKSVLNPFRKGFRITSEAEDVIEEKVREIKPDLIHLQDPAAIGAKLRNIGKNLNIKVIITNHFSLEYALSYVRFLGPAIPIARNSLISYLVNFYNKCDMVVTPTETFRKQVESWGVTVPVRAVSNGINFDKYQKEFPQKEICEFREKYHIPSNPIVLYLGRIDKDKRIDTLVSAIPEVLKKKNAHFVIAGDGDELENIKSLSEELNIRNNLTFLGKFDQGSDDFLLVYRSASLFAIPSPIETQSIVTLEAMSSGLPVVAANANALPELVKNDFDGYLFETGNAKDLANKIVKILSNKGLAKKFSENAQILASHHKMPLAFDAMISTYRECLEQ